LVTIRVYAVCAIEAGEASLLAGRIPLLLAACQRTTTTTGLMRRYQLRWRLRRAGDLAAPRAAPLLGAAAVSSAWLRTIRLVSAVSGMGPPSDGANRVYGCVRADDKSWAAEPWRVEPSAALGAERHAQGPAKLSAERRETADRSRSLASRDRCTGTLLAARGNPCHHHRPIVYLVNRFY